MKDKLIPMAAAIILLCPFGARAQDKGPAFEFGLGGSAFNHTRTMVSDFHLTRKGDYVFTLEEKLLYGGVNIYAARELKNWLYIDIQGNLGLARYYDSGGSRRGMSLLAGPGMQFRPLTGSEWVQPYFRLGLNYYHKNFPTACFGQFDGDVTKEAIWKAQDAWNKGYTFDTDSFLPVSVGIGLIGWLGNRVGIRLEGDCMRSFGSKGTNFAQGTIGLVFRLGGNDKRMQSPGPERIVERVVEKEVVREVPVETVKELVREVPCENTLARLMDNVTFDFDKADLDTSSEAVLDEVARVIGMFPDDRFLVAGHTDARGGEAYNEKLSVARAKAVYDALLKRGVPESRLCYRGFGKRTALIPAGEEDSMRRGDRKVVIERVSMDSLWK